MYNWMSSVYVAGSFNDDLTIYNASGKQTTLPTLPYTTSDTYNQNNNTFLVKYDTNGQALWRARLGNNKDFEEFGTNSIALDVEENVYVSGTTATSLFHVYNANDSLAFTLTKPENTSFVGFLAKYNSHGNALWVTFLGGKDNNTNGAGTNSLITDAFGNVFVTGAFYNSLLYLYNANYNGSYTIPPLKNTLTDEKTGFVAKYNSQGKALWGAVIGATDNNEGNLDGCSGTSIYLDTHENLYVTGFYDTTAIKVYNSNGVASSLPSLQNTSGDPNNVNTFVVKYDSQGNAVWGTRIGGADSIEKCRGISISIDTIGNVYVTGAYNNSLMNVYNANGSSFTIPGLKNTGNNQMDIFVVKYNSEGQALWATRMGGQNGSEDYGISIDVDSHSNVVVTGMYSDSEFFMYDADGTTSTLPSLKNTSSDIGGQQNVFVVKYDTNGKGLWGTRIGGIDLDNKNNGAGSNSLSVDSVGNVYVTGAYYSALINIYNANGSTFTIPGLQNTGSNAKDAFVVKYDPDGQAVWGTRMGNTSGIADGYAIATNRFFSNNNVCFPPGTPLKTDQGIIPIDRLRPGYHTIDNKPIEGIVRTPNHEKSMICFERDALAPGVPSLTTLISQEHKVFYENTWIVARFFVGPFGDKVYKTAYDGDALYNVLLEEHASMYVNNMKVETLHPKNPAAKKFRAKKMQQGYKKTM